MNIIQTALETIREIYFKAGFCIGCIIVAIIFVVIVMIKNQKGRICSTCGHAYSPIDSICVNCRDSSGILRPEGDGVAIEQSLKRKEDL